MSHLTAKTAQTELMRWHYQLDHLSFSKLQDLAQAEIIPKKLSNICPLSCPGCTYGKMHRVPWRNKS